MKRAAVGLAGAAMVVAAVVRYPPDPTLSFDVALFTWPDRAKLAAVLASCAGLLSLDFAAYAVGRTLHRWLRPRPPSIPGLALLERVGLGLLALANLALALAAARLLHRPLILGLVLALALAGGCARGPGPSGGRTAVREYPAARLGRRLARAEPAPRRLGP